MSDDSSDCNIFFRSVFDELKEQIAEVNKKVDAVLTMQENMSKLFGEIISIQKKHGNDED